MGRRAGRNMVRGTRATSCTYLATVYTALGIRVRLTRRTRPAQARLFVRPVGSTGLSPLPSIRKLQLHHPNELYNPFSMASLDSSLNNFTFGVEIETLLRPQKRPAVIAELAKYDYEASKSLNPGRPRKEN
jgi:hypothetical protein